MAKIYSWKIDCNNYGYLYIDGNRHISEKITEKHQLDMMVGVMREWDAAKAEEEFNKMAEEVHTLYPNKRMVWSPEYWTNGGIDGQTVLVISRNEEECKTDFTGVFENFMESVNEKIRTAQETLNDKLEDYIGELNVKVNSIIGEVNTLITSALDSIEETKADLINKINDAKRALDEVKDFLDSDLTSDKIKDGIEKIEDIGDKYIEIKDDVTDIKDKITDIDDVVEPFKDSDPNAWKNMHNDYDSIRKRFKLTEVTDLEEAGAFSYMVNAIESISGNVENVVTVTENIDNLISGKVGNSISEINDNINSLREGLQRLEREIKQDEITDP